jgi:hypothetical protein
MAAAAATCPGAPPISALERTRSRRAMRRSTEISAPLSHSATDMPALSLPSGQGRPPAPAPSRPAAGDPAIASARGSRRSVVGEACLDDRAVVRLGGSMRGWMHAELLRN